MTSSVLPPRGPDAPGRSTSGLGRSVHCAQRSPPALPAAAARAAARTACHVPTAGGGGGSARCLRAHTSRFLSRIKLFLDVLMKEVLHPESRSPDGVRFHCIDVYLDELSKVGGKEVSHVLSASAAGTGKGGGWDRASAALQTPRVLGAGARGWHCGTSHRRA